MKKFIYEVIILLGLVVGSGNFLYNIQKSALAEKFFSINETLDIINLGTSHGYSFDYSDIVLNGDSFNKGSNTPYYDLQNYKYLKKYLANRALIVLPVSFFSFGVDENRTEISINNPFVNDFYEYLPKNSIYSYSVAKSRNLIIYRIQSNFKSLFSGEKQKIKDELFNRDLHIENIRKHAIEKIRFHKKAGTFSDPEKNVNYLSMLITDAQKSGYRLVLVTTPYHQEYNQGFEKDWLNKNYYQYMFYLSNKYNILYLDYSDDSRFTNNDLLFSDSNHLNKKGKTKFSRIFWQDLIKLGLLNEEDIQTNRDK
ncbi:MAG: hypothetical protein AB4063_01850 [Crocosphaera sp.]